MPTPRPAPSLPRLLLAVLCLSTGLLAGLALPAAAQQARFNDAADVVEIEVPVTVTSQDGEPVADLTAEDFEVYDGRRRRPIVGFERIVLDRGAAASEAQRREGLPAAGRRHFLFFFDLAFSEPDAVVRAREAARDIIAHALHPEDLAAVATYSTRQGTRLVLGFTPDRAQLTLALDTLGTPSLTEERRDPLGLVFAEERPAFVGDEVQNEGRREVETAIQDYVKQVSGFNPNADRKEQAARVSAMTRQMAAFAQTLDSVRGRKYVVYLSEGFDDKLLVGAGGDARVSKAPRGELSDAALGRGPDITAADSIATGDYAGVDTDAMYGSGRVQSSLQDMIQAFKRADCTIEAVDIGGLRTAGERGGGSAVGGGGNALSQLASETGGEVFRNFNDLGEAMERMLDRTRVTYLLSIQPEELKRDGKYHRLRVKLAKGGRDLKVQHRPGYYAPRAPEERSAYERRLSTASELLDEAGGALPTAVLATPFPGGGEGSRADARAFVPVLIEVDGAVLTAGLEGSVAPVEIYAYALEENGGVADFFSQTLPIDLGQVGEQLRRTGLKYFGHLQLDPGSYQLRILVRNLETGIRGLTVYPLVVPDFSSRRAALSSPLVPEEPGRWVLVTEPEERRRGLPFPYLLGQRTYLPAASPRVPPSGESEVAALFFEPEEMGALTLTGRLVNAAGEEVPGASIDEASLLPGPLPNAAALHAKMRLAAVPPGEYRLELTAVGADGRATVTASAPITVAASPR